MDEETIEEQPEEVRTPSLNLFQVVRALEQNNIQSYLDVGVHGNCQINSNCPIAIELRKVIAEAGVNLVQLLEGYASSMATPEEPVTYNFPELDGKVSIRVANQDISLDLTEILERQLGTAWRDKLRELDSSNQTIVRLGRGLYSTYLQKVADLDRDKTLPALSYTVQDLFAAGCYITTDSEHYIFLFPLLYHPQWIVNHGVRFKMTDEDIAATTFEVCVKICLTVDRKITNVELINTNGAGFEHYHGGSSGDCWGFVEIPERWDGDLKSLKVLVGQLTGALATVNFNSLMQNQPTGMPDIREVLDRSTELGEEGVMGTGEERPEGRHWGTPAAEDEAPDGEEPDGGEDTPRRWGERRPMGEPEVFMGDIPPHETARVIRDEFANPHTDEEMQYFRRWGVYGNPQDTQAICALCGEIWGVHANYTCPRDRRR